MKSKEPQVGMGATICFASDSHAATIVEVSASKRRVVVQRDQHQRMDKNGLSESQEYRYRPNPEAAMEVFTLRKNGRYVEEGGGMKSGTSLAIGVRREYRDPSF